MRDPTLERLNSGTSGKHHLHQRRHEEGCQDKDTALDAAEVHFQGKALSVMSPMPAIAEAMMMQARWLKPCKGL